MGKSTTKKELTEFDIEKIKRFTHDQLEEYKKSDIPFCYQVGNDVLVGRCRVVKIDKSTWRVFDNGVQVFDFFKRKDAIFYCIALHQNNHILAQEIKNMDEKLNRLEFEAIMLRKHYKSAKERNDAWKVDMYSAKYIDVMHRLDQVKKDLEKSIDLAKYIKI
jgi:hypothetical protein